MNIVVITGSPRKNGNSFAMTAAFVRRAEELGHTIRRFDAAFLKIGGVVLARHVIRPVKHVRSTMILMQLLLRFWRQMWWFIRCRCTGILFRRRSREL